MYYLAFFRHYPLFFKEKIKRFLNGDLSKVWLEHENQENALHSLDTGIFSPENYWKFFHGQHWCIHGSYIKEFNRQDRPKLPLFNGTSMEQVNTLLRWLSERYLWSIFPWGGWGMRFSSFAFLSRDRSLRDRFLEASPNQADINSLELGLEFCLPCNIPQCNLLISKYDVAGNFSDLAQVLLFEELKEAGMAVWDACGCDATAPFLIGEFYVPAPGYESLDDPWSEQEFDPEFDPEYDFVKIMELFIEERDTNLYRSYFHPRLGVVRPRNRKSFNLMCRQDIGSQPDIEIIVPQDTNLELLQSLLGKIEADRDDWLYSDLNHFEEFFEVVQWFYGLSRDLADHDYSLFVSRQNALVQKVAAHLSASKHSDLISCF